MGLFSKKKNDAGSIIREWDIAPYKGTAHFSGWCHNNCFYTYNYDAIKDLRLGTQVTIEAVAADVFLRSSHGLEKFVDGHWGIVYSLDGQLLGATKAKHNEIRQLLKDGYKVVIDAVIDYDKDIKSKTLLLGFSEMTIE